MKYFIENFYLIRSKNTIKLLLNMFCKNKYKYSHYKLAFDHMIVYGYFDDLNLIK